MAYIAKEQTVMHFNGMALVEKNTFLDFPSEVEDACRRRRKSAPNFEWRYVFSPVQHVSTSTTSKVNSHAVSEVAEPGSKKENLDSATGTLMMKNIPCSCKREDVIGLLEESGYMKLSNFFYLPSRNGKILGYAFIGFADVAIADNFRTSMSGYQMAHKKSTRVISVVPANIQGVSNNLNHFKGTAVMQSDARPIFRETENR